MIELAKHYLKVTKPGIVAGNLVSVAGGFFLPARCDIDWKLFLATVVGLSLVVASGCVINNCIDRDIDAKMQRTRNRATVTGAICTRRVFLFGVLLGVLGFVLLLLFTNPLALSFAVFGFVVYIGLYSLYMKRRSVYGTLLGSLSGAVPPVVGYCAVLGRFDSGAAILLALFSLWQMPHSYAIAIFRYQDYLAANIPVLPVTQGIVRAKLHITLYIALFAVAAVLLPLSGYTGVAFVAVACTTSCWWLAMALRGYHQNIDINVWARQIFGFSIVTITALSISMALDCHTSVESLPVLLGSL